MKEERVSSHSLLVVSILILSTVALAIALIVAILLAEQKYSYPNGEVVSREPYLAYGCGQKYCDIGIGILTTVISKDNDRSAMFQWYDENMISCYVRIGSHRVNFYYNAAYELTSDGWTILGPVIQTSR